MKAKLIKHLWRHINGFRRHQCEHCNCIKYWDDRTGKMMFTYDGKISPVSPKCKLPNSKPFNN
jgi:hypothetical protein